MEIQELFTEEELNETKLLIKTKLFSIRILIDSLGFENIKEEFKKEIPLLQGMAKKLGMDVDDV